MFGGFGYVTDGQTQILSDMWTFFNGGWARTAASGSGNMRSQHTVQYIPATSSWPGSRAEAAHWIDAYGYLWMFGGNGFPLADGTETAGTYTGTHFSPYDFSTDVQSLVVSVDSGAEQVIPITANCDTLHHAATAITVVGATVSVDGDVLVISSDTTGPSSSISVGSGSGPNVKLLFGEAASGKFVGTSFTRYDFSSLASPATYTATSFAAHDFSTAATSGVYRGTSFSPYAFGPTAGTFAGTGFTAYNFRIANENLYVTIDGGSEQVVPIISFCDSPSAAAAAISISGASVSVVDGMLVITSSTTGAQSSVWVSPASGANAKAMFGIGVAVAGLDATAETLLVTVDGIEQTVLINANCDTNDHAAAAISIDGATVSASGGVLVITSDTAGPLSSVAVGSGSGSHALALFGVGYQIVGHAAPVAIDGTNFVAVACNDMWYYDGSNWAWVGGLDVGNGYGEHWSQGVSSSDNWIGSRSGASSYVDQWGVAHIFGGRGHTRFPPLTELND
eukprot:SAG31_NODE_3390_length_4327_cov_2.098392_1_plen_507_part_10